MIVALYVETDGAYFGLQGIDPWDEARDARLYAGPHAIVAHDTSKENYHVHSHWLPHPCVP